MLRTKNQILIEAAASSFESGSRRKEDFKITELCAAVVCVAIEAKVGI